MRRYTESFLIYSFVLRGRHYNLEARTQRDASDKFYKTELIHHVVSYLRQRLNCLFRIRIQFKGLSLFLQR